MGAIETSNFIRREHNLNPVISFTLDIWHSIVKQLKIGKEIGLLFFLLLFGLHLMINLHQENLMRDLNIGQKKELQPYAQLSKRVK